MSNRKTIEKTIFVIKNIEKKSIHFRHDKNKDSAKKKFKKRKRNDNVNKNKDDRFNTIFESKIFKKKRNFVVLNAIDRCHPWGEIVDYKVNHE